MTSNGCYGFRGTPCTSALEQANARFACISRSAGNDACTVIERWRYEDATRQAGAPLGAHSRRALSRRLHLFGTKSGDLARAVGQVGDEPRVELGGLALLRQLLLRDADPGLLFLVLELESPGVREGLLEHAARVGRIAQPLEELTVADLRLETDRRAR